MTSVLAADEAPQSTWIVFVDGVAGTTHTEHGDPRPGFPSSGHLQIERHGILACPPMGASVVFIVTGAIVAPQRGARTPTHQLSFSHCWPTREEQCPSEAAEGRRCGCAPDRTVRSEPPARIDQQATAAANAALNLRHTGDAERRPRILRDLDHAGELARFPRSGRPNCRRGP